MVGTQAVVYATQAQGDVNDATTCSREMYEKHLSNVVFFFSFNRKCDLLFIKNHTSAAWMFAISCLKGCVHKNIVYKRESGDIISHGDRKSVV